ncbi:ribosomal protein L5 [Athelia psychrophila]|uniref:Ribosomal protein L5 n=1 Tax=Athelia psychrophila TaxID=1759441 RepID=A0A166PQB0_9AGAM|nr:ribosomal protein L5 [Fibularhizoctonia sp. CBS 109695]
MSVAAVAETIQRSAATTFRRPPRIRQPLRLDRNRLPIPNLRIVVGDTHQSRLEEHYHNTLSDDLMYMTYIHEDGPRPPPRQIRLTYDPNDPYTKNRHNPPVGGSQLGKKPPPPSTSKNVVRLEKIAIHSMVREAITSKSNLIGAITALRALSGENPNGGGRESSDGVQVAIAKTTAHKWKVRPGVPIGCTVELKGPKMYEFLGTLVEFVLPRLREFPGIVMPPMSQSMATPSGVSGVVSFGLPPEAMGLFPQIELNMDMYPKSYGMHIHFITNAEGVGAQNRARALVSGFQVPLSRK